MLPKSEKKVVFRVGSSLGICPSPTAADLRQRWRPPNRPKTAENKTPTRQTTFNPMAKFVLTRVNVPRVGFVLDMWPIWPSPTPANLRQRCRSPNRLKRPGNKTQPGK